MAFCFQPAGLGALIGALTVAALAHRRVKGRIWTVGSFILPVTLFVFAFVRTLPLSLLLLVGIGWGLMAMVNTSNAMVQEEVPDEIRGRVMGFYILVFFGSGPIGSLLAGWMAGTFTAPVTVMICLFDLIAVCDFYACETPLHPSFPLTLNKKGICIATITDAQEQAIF